MAPTIGRQWHGGPEDYAALCDYCDVRYLRSQLRHQSNGRLACFGPGTNGCGAGRDEIALDKINAEKMRNRRRPSKHQGGRFDRVRASVEEIFGASLVEYWDAQKGVVSSSSTGRLTSWMGQKFGAPITPRGSAIAHFYASVPEFYGRPGISFINNSADELGTPVVALLGAGCRPYIGAVCSALGTIAFLTDSTTPRAIVSANLGPSEYRAVYWSEASAGVGTQLPIPASEVGNKNLGRLYELDATGPLSFRAGSAEVESTVDSPTQDPWVKLSLQRPIAITFLVLCDGPNAEQIADFRALGRSMAVMRP